MSLGSGAALGGTALTAAQTSAVDVITGFTGTFANNIGFWLLIAVVVATLWGVKYLIHKYTTIHRG
jgi:hypothetical protein